MTIYTSVSDMGHRLKTAMQQWVELLGIDYVLNNTETLAIYARSTSSCGTRPLAFKPGSTEDVVRVVKIAGTFCIPLYPMSRGKNWGYGDGAITDGQVIVDLSRMDRIIEVDRPWPML